MFTTPPASNLPLFVPAVPTPLTPTSARNVRNSMLGNAGGGGQIERSTTKRGLSPNSAAGKSMIAKKVQVADGTVANGTLHTIETD